MKTGKRPFALRIPFVEKLGFELWGFGDGQAELRLDIAETHLNSWDVAHGGVLMTMMDVAMAHAARSAGLEPGTVPQGPGLATIEMKTSFLRAAEGRLRAVGRLLHKTSSLAFCEASVFDEAGQLCAHATGTFKFLRAMPASGRRIKPLQHAAAADPDSTGESP